MEPLGGAWEDGILEKLLRAYDLGSDADWDIFSGDSGDKRVLLTADGREFTVQAMDAALKGALALNAELDLREYLCQRHYPVAELVMTRGAARYLSFGAYHYVVTALENAQPYDPSDPSHCVEAATGLAQFHDAAREFPGAAPMGDSPYLTQVVEQRLEWLEAYLSPEANHASSTGLAHHLRHSLQAARQELEFLLPGIAAAYQSEPRRLIHGAYDRRAVTFDGLGLAEVGALEHVGFDLRLSDLTRSLLSFGAIPHPGGVSCLDMDPSVVGRFLGAYEHLSPLTAVEARSLPLFLRATHLAWIVDDCHRLISTSARDEDDGEGDRNAHALCLALQLGFAPFPHGPETQTDGPHTINPVP